MKLLDNNVLLQVRQIKVNGQPEYAFEISSESLNDSWLTDLGKKIIAAVNEHESLQNYRGGR